MSVCQCEVNPRSILSNFWGSLHLFLFLFFLDSFDGVLEFQCNEVDFHRALRLCGFSIVKQQIVHQFPGALHKALLLFLVLLLMECGDIP